VQHHSLKLSLKLQYVSSAEHRALLLGARALLYKLCAVTCTEGNANSFIFYYAIRSLSVRANVDSRVVGAHCMSILVCVLCLHAIVTMP
jgi:hypothetical protein